MKKVPANRLAAGGASAAAVAAAIVTVIGAVDTGPKAAVVSVGLAVIGVVVVVFLLGAQKDEARRAVYAPVVTSVDGVSGTTATLVVPEPDPEFDPDPSPPKADPSVAQSHLDGGAA